jgi:hypothetical protein
MWRSLRSSSSTKLLKEEKVKVQPEKFVRKPFFVEAVPVTEENLDAVATWCGGEVKTIPGNGDTQEVSYVKVDVQRPLHENQTRAFPGTWVLKSGSNFKVYTNKAFKSSFDPAQENATV